MSSVKRFFREEGIANRVYSIVDVDLLVLYCRKGCIDAACVLRGSAFNS